VTQKDGAVFREVLVALSDAESSYPWGFFASPVPVRNHRTTLRVLPITERNRCYVEWFSRFEIDVEHEAPLAELMNRNFLAGSAVWSRSSAAELKTQGKSPGPGNENSCIRGQS
jgi:hypothetical protein